MPEPFPSAAVPARLDRLAWRPIHTWITLALGIGAALAPLALVLLSRRAAPFASFALLASFYALGAAAMIPWWIWGPEGRGRPMEMLAADKNG